VKRFIALIAVALATPAAAQTASPETDRVLWCASAFYWLAGSAADSGEDTESKVYDRWANRLMEVGSAALFAEGFQPDTIEQMIATYDQKALVELADNTATYDVTKCPELLGDWQ
jgi:hypothetical protein